MKQVILSICAGIALSGVIASAHAEIIFPKEESPEKHNSHVSESVPSIPGIARIEEEKNKHIVLSPRQKVPVPFQLTPELAGCIQFFLLMGLPSQESAVYACTVKTRK